jgi:phytoene desaturase
VEGPARRQDTHVSRVIVIGGGVGGMATAARLAVKGHEVTLCEQAATLGGKCQAFEQDGFVFDTGPSLFTLPAVYRDLFLKTGASLEETVDLQPVDPAFGYHFADGSTLVLPGVDPAKCADAMQAAFSGTAGADWRAFMQRAGDMWRITREPFLQSPLTGWRNLLSLAKHPSDVGTIAPTKSLRALAKEYLNDPRQVTLIDRYATYTGSDPRKAPAVLATVPYVEQTFGAWHLAGGVSQLSAALAERCRQCGVDIRTSVDVEHITVVDGRVSGVRLTSGEVLSADIVVANADAGLVYGEMMTDPQATKLAASIAKNTPSLAGFVILLAVRGRTPGLQHHNVWFPANYDAEFDDIFGRDPQPVRDPAIYVCAPDDPLMRPGDDHESWFILVNAPRHGTAGNGTFDWTTPGVAEQYADRVLEILAERGMDVRDRVLWREIRTPADLEARVRAPQGAIYGTSSNGARSAFQRPANQSPIPGLFLVGGSAHPGGGLPLVGMSAEIVANLIGRDR